MNLASPKPLIKFSTSFVKANCSLLVPARRGKFTCARLPFIRFLATCNAAFPLVLKALHPPPLICTRQARLGVSGSEGSIFSQYTFLPSAGHRNQRLAQSILSRFVRFGSSRMWLLPCPHRIMSVRWAASCSSVAPRYLIAFSMLWRGCAIDQQQGLQQVCYFQRG
jgi:hypothetical protein